MRYFARALRAWPPEKAVLLRAVHVKGLGWTSWGNRGVFTLRCRPTGAAAVRKLAVVHIRDGEEVPTEAWQLEGDIKVEVSGRHSAPLKSVQPCVTEVFLFSRSTDRQELSLMLR